MSAVSLDIGSSSLAVVEIKHTRDGSAVTDAGVQPLPDGLVIDGEVAQPLEVAQHIQALWQRLGLKSKRVRLGVANQRVFVRTIDIQAIDDDETRRAAVTFEAGEHLPIPQEQALIDYAVLGRIETDAGLRDRIMVVAAHREMVDSLLDAVRGAGLQPEGIDLEAFALIRALLPPGQIGADPATQPARAICHVGANATNVVVAVGSQCNFTRLLSTGGTALTRAVAERTGRPFPEAEMLKRACGLLGPAPANLDGDLVATVRQSLALGAQPLVQEVSRSLAYYRQQPFARPVERVLLSGGSALCVGLDRYLAQGLGLPVHVANPIANVDGSTLDPSVAVQSVVALGLGLDGEEG